MKPAALHTPSLLVGSFASVTLLLLTSQSATQPFPSGRFSFGPHPRDFVTLREGQPFTVPSGSMFVPTAIGSTELFGQVTLNGVNLLADGHALLASTNDFRVLTIPQHTPRTNMLAVPTGSSAVAGTVLTVTGGTQSAVDGRVWGYLSAVSTPVTNRINPMLEYAPRPQDLLRISGTAFVVPPDKLFVPTALGTSNLGTSLNSTEHLVWLTVDGQNALGATVRTGDATHNEVSTQPLHGTVAMPPGSVLHVAGGASQFQACVFGYLADA